ncbi:MAG: hypothetical protein MK207_06355 [Saprospiraceae bacterium]|nr:hypothetical protein [Saprospiraceae bacterium]
MKRFFKQFLSPILIMGLNITLVTTSIGQYARGNSPYSRYGLGDLSGSMFTPNSSMGGGLCATYRSFWDVNLTNPASLGKLRYTAFQLGINYEHNEMSEKTGEYAQADNGNLTYVSLAFPITKSWEIIRDTLRRGIPIQWGMGFNLMPYTNVSYDVSVTRKVSSIDSVLFNYTGEGNKYRVNWSNGFTYKGFSLGGNVGLIFGKLSNSTFINFQDSSNKYSYDDQYTVNENGVGFIWDVGVQYEYVFKNKSGISSSNTNYSIDNKLAIGAYAGGVSDIVTTSNQYYTRQSLFHGVDTIQNISGVEGSLVMPIKIGGGISFGNEIGLLIGASYETELWDMFRRDNVKDPNLTNSHTIAIGMQIVPDFSDYSGYFNRVRYRLGIHYSLDARAISPKGTRYQLIDYGLSIGAGFPMRPPKSKTVLGFVNLGFDVGYLGHPELINDIYFKVNLGFSLNSSGWFDKSKFR